MKSNEIIGVPALIIGLGSAIFSMYSSSITLSIMALVLAVACLFIMLIFLSYWGLTTFNDWIEKIKINRHKS